jgi:hypothetical protein
MTRPDATSLPVQRRKQARQWERDIQIELAVRLSRLLDPACVFWTSIDNQPWSKVAGIKRKLRGCRAGTPDVLILYKGKLIFLELKSRVGKVSEAQRDVRLQILRAGGMWWLVRSVRAGLTALHRSGVELRTRAGRQWVPPVLPAWEEPVSDLEQPIVWHPAVLRQWREDKARSRARQREREAALAAKQCQPKNIDGAAGRPIDCDHSAVLGTPMHRTAQRWFNIREGSHARHSSNSDSEG